MGAAYPVAVKEKVRDLWENKGYGPDEILEALQDFKTDGTFRRVPEDPSTLRKWAKAQNWSPWKEAQVRELARPLDCFTRVLLYLATVAGFKYIHDYVANKPQAPDKEILYATQLHITGEFFVPGIGGIGPDISRRVRPVLKGQIKGRRQYWSDLEAEVRTVTNNPRH